MAIDAILLNDRRHAVLVLRGRVDDGSGPSLCESLRVSARCHTVVDVRQIAGVTPELTKSLLWALGQALDRGRTVRLVVADAAQRRKLCSFGLGGMVPMHDSIADAMAAVEDVISDRLARHA